MTLGADLDRALAAPLAAAADAQATADLTKFGLTAMDERLTADEAEIGTISKRVSDLEGATEIPPPPPPVALDVHGPGIRGQSKGNVQSGGTDRQRQTIVFRAKRTGLIDTVQVSFRGGLDSAGKPSYSNGTGGQHRFAFADEAGTPIGMSGLHIPGNPSTSWTTYPRIGVGAPVEAGKLYRLDIDNIDPDPTRNMASLNHLFNWDGPPPNARRQPRFPVGDWELYVSKGPGLGTIDPRHTAVAALRYSTGEWQGQGYVGVISGSFLPGASVGYGVIGGTRKVRSTWQVTDPDTISTLYVGGIRCQTPADLHLSFWGPSGELDDIICPAIPTTTPGLDGGGSVFVGGKFPKGRASLAPGAYQVRLSSNGLWSAAPIREGTEYGFDPLIAWPYGKFQVSSDGTNFTDPYAGLDLQWYGER